MNYIEVNKNWADFKTVVSDNGLSPQYYKLGTGSEAADVFKIYALNGYFMYATDIAESVTPGSDGKDFADNYQNIWNATLDYRDQNGLIRVHTSPRPSNNDTYFSGCGDNGGIGSGNRMLFNMDAGDSSKSKTLTFSESVHIKDGVINFIGAPIGASISIEVLNTLDVTLKRFAKRYNIIGDGVIYLNSEDSSELPSSLKLKITVNNSVAPPGSPTQEQLDNGEADNEAPVAFKVVGNIEVYRLTTV